MLDSREGGGISAEHEDADRLDRAGMCTSRQAEWRGMVPAQIGIVLVLNVVAWLRKEFFLKKPEFYDFIEFLPTH